MAATDSLLTVPEAATRLRLHRVSIYRAIAHGRLRAIRLGDARGSLRVSEEALDAFLIPARRTGERRAGGRPRSASAGRAQVERGAHGQRG